MLSNSVQSQKAHLKARYKGALSPFYPSISSNTLVFGTAPPGAVASLVSMSSVSKLQINQPRNSSIVLKSTASFTAHVHQQILRCCHHLPMTSWPQLPPDDSTVATLNMTITTPVPPKFPQNAECSGLFQTFLIYFHCNFEFLRHVKHPLLKLQRNIRPQNGPILSNSFRKYIICRNPQRMSEGMGTGQLETF